MTEQSEGAADPARVVVVVPALDPGPALVTFVAGLAELRLEVMVVDDGSDASTTPVFDALAGLAGVRVLHHAINYGKGAALKTAFRELVLQSRTVETVVTAAADGRHRADDVAAIVAAARGKPQAMVLGVRRRRGQLSAGERLLKRVMEGAFRLRTGCRLHDLQTGLRALPRDLVLEALTVHANGYEFDAALLRRGVAWEREVVEVPITTAYGEGREHSHFRPWRDSARVFAGLLGRLERH